MAVNLNNVGEVDFSTTYFSTLTSYSVLMWIKTIAYNAAISRIWQNGEGATSKFSVFGLAASASGTELTFTSNPDGGTVGVWITTTDPIIVGAIQHIAVTFNASNVSNDPVIYINGSPVAISKTSTPSGAGAILTADTERIGRTTLPFNGIIYNRCVYNRILSASEILEAYNSKLAISSWNGLVFAPALWQAKGSPADGGTMSASNTVPDLISGAQGVPNGSPVFNGDTVLTIKGVH